MDDLTFDGQAQTGGRSTISRRGVLAGALGADLADLRRRLPRLRSD